MSNSNELVQCFEDTREMALKDKNFSAITGKAINNAVPHKVYDSWKRKNKYFNKRFSILGDSISTLKGFNPRGYSVFFEGENCEKTGVNDMSDTWWGKVIEFFGGELLVNNSWSGSRVTRLPDKDEDFPSGISDERTNGLHINSVKPDVIIVYLGTNDWAYGVNLNYIDYLGDKLTPPWYSFEESYYIMLQKICANYPDAEIFCCTLSTTFMSSKPSFSFPFSHGGTHIEEYNKIIRSVSSQFKCKLVDLYNFHLPYDAVDGSHPTSEGMNTLATMMIRGIDAGAGNQFLTCCNDNHDFIIAEEFTGGTKYICRKCGFTDTSSRRSKFDFLKHYFGSIIEHKTYSWTSEMNACDIRSFKLSCGNYPVVEYEFIGQNLLYHNRINGSRDGGNYYPDGYFNDKKIELTKKDVDCINTTVCNIPFHNWQTDIQVFDKLQCCGFSLLNTFSCQFKNGVNFVYYGSSLSKPRGFDDLCTLLASLTGNMHLTQDVVKEKADCTGVIDSNSGNTCELFPNDDEIRLFQVSKSKNFIIQKTNINVGSDHACELWFNSESISRQHATFIFDGQNWMLIDNYSKKGTWINDIKLVPGKKYILHPDDSIDFALSEKLIFFKTKQSQQNSKAEANNSQASSIVHKQEPDLFSGKSIDDKYVLDTVIGHGGATTVYLGHDITGKKYAVKAINKATVFNKNILDSLCGEAQLLSELEHPCIRKVIDFCQEESFVFLVFEYIDGMNLEQVLQSNNGEPLPYEQVIDFSKQIANALQYIHSLSPPVINRDVKPSNIVIDKEGNVKMVDFDIAMQYNPKKSDDICLGTMGYAAPEQFKGKSEPRSDIYALGMTMYYLVTGIDPKKPLDDTTPLCQVNSILPKGLEYIIKKCIAVNVDDRYKNAAELIFDLNNYRELP